MDNNKANETLTAEQRRRTEQALRQTQRYIDRESSRSSDLRPADVQELLNFHIAHRAKLVKMLAA